MSKHEFVGIIKGLRVFLGVSASPEGFDAAVCSTDAVGTPGAQSIIALHVAGLSPETALGNFTPPVKLVREGKFPVLVVQATSLPGRPEGTRWLLENNLPAGLRRLEGVVQKGASVWMPLLGTGADALEPGISALLTLEALEQWSGPPLDVLLSTHDQPTVEAVRRALLDWKFSRSGLRIAGGSLEIQPKDIFQHCREAFLCADKLSGAQTNPIGANDLLLGISTVSVTKFSSRAFSKFNGILPLSKTALVQRYVGAVPGKEGQVEIKPLSPGLSKSLARGLRYSDGVLNGRILVTAALLSSEEQALNELCRSVDTSLMAVREKWFEFVTSDQANPRIDWKGWWRESGVELLWERFTQAGFIADTQANEDQLGIDAEAQALARLVLDVNVSPPLSIGLLGDWGSGKSFFLERMQQAVAWLRDASGGLCRDVVQIRFNAWHFSDTNVWASMVAHIFDEILSHLTPRRSSDEERDQLRRDLNEAQGAFHEAESQLYDARAALKTLQQSYDKQLKLLALDRTVDEQMKLVDDELREQMLAAAESVGWGRHLKAINDVEESLKALNSSTSDMRMVLSTALRRGPLLWSMGIASGITLAGMGLSAAGVWVDSVWWRTFLQSLGGIVAGVGAVASAVAVPLTRAASLVKRFRSKLEEARNAYETSLDKLSNQGTKEAKRITQARRELDSLREARDAAERRLAELQQRQAALEPNRLLRDFLAERAESQDYRSRQGIISLVRRDFEKLSQLMRDARQRKESSSDKRSLERIILYVDDLDRCSPERVVEVLEAIHLLLATDLFVVVVAVDSRWLLRSLQVRYREMLDLDEAQLDDPYRVSTPQNYLEKIFQIPLALAPMPVDGFDRYVEYLTGSSIRAARSELAVFQGEPDRSGGGEEVLLKHTPKREESPQDGNARALPAEQQASQPTPAKQPQSEAPAQTEPVTRPPPRPLVIRPDEQGLLKALAPLLPTPRIVKRLVNVFRLIKAAVPPERLSTFENPEQGRYRPVLLLLAILYGRPTHADVLLKKLHEKTLRQGFTGVEPDPTLHDALAHMARLEGAREGIDWSALAQIVRTVAPEVRVSECEPEARLVARYSFVTGQHCHTWSEPVAATTQPTEPAPANVSTKQSAA